MTQNFPQRGRKCSARAAVSVTGGTSFAVGGLRLILNSNVRGSDLHIDGNAEIPENPLARQQPPQNYTWPKSQRDYRKYPWVERSDTHGNVVLRAFDPEGIVDRSGLNSVGLEIFDICIPSGCLRFPRSLSTRWCRRFAPQPPANIFQAVSLDRL